MYCTISDIGTCDVGNIARVWRCYILADSSAGGLSPDLYTNKCGESLDGSEILDEQMIEEECSDSNQPGEGANISSNITMVSVKFSVKEEMLVVPDEVHEMVRTEETLITHLLCWSGSASRRESWRWW